VVYEIKVLNGMKRIILNSEINFYENYSTDTEIVKKFLKEILGGVYHIKTVNVLKLIEKNGAKMIAAVRSNMAPDDEDYLIIEIVEK